MKRFMLKTLLICIVVSVVGVPCIWLKFKPDYTVQGSIRVAPVLTNLLTGEADLGSVVNIKSFMNTQAQIITSTQVCERVADDLWDKNLEFLQKGPFDPVKLLKQNIKGVEEKLSPVQILKQAISDGTISAIPAKESELITVSMTGPDQVEAKRIVDSFIKAYMSVEVSASVRGEKQTLIILETEQKVLAAKLANLRTQIKELASKFGTKTLDSRYPILQYYLKDSNQYEMLIKEAKVNTPDVQQSTLIPNLDMRMLKVRSLIESGTKADIDQAEELLVAITDDHPQNIEAWLLLGEISFSHQEYGKAIDYALKGLVSSPENINLLKLKAKSEYKRSPVLAISTPKMLYDLNPKDILNAISLAEVYVEIGQTQKAVDLLSKQLDRVEMDSRQEMKLNRVSMLLSEVTKNEALILQLEAQVEFKKEKLAELEKKLLKSQSWPKKKSSTTDGTERTAYIESDPEVASLRSEILYVKRALVHMALYLQPTNPDYLRKQDLLAELQENADARKEEVGKIFDELKIKSLSKQYQQELDSAREELSWVESELARNLALREKFSDMLSKERGNLHQPPMLYQQDELELTKETYEAITRRIQELEMESKRPARISVAFNADVSETNDPRIILTVITVISGFVLGLIFAVISLIKRLSKERR